MDIVQYFLVNWEQLSDDAPDAVSCNEGVSKSGYLQIKTTNIIGIASWRQVYFVIRYLCAARDLWLVNTAS